MSTVNEAVEAAFNSLESPAEDNHEQEKPPVVADAPAEPEEKPPVQGRQRDPSGKFVKGEGKGDEVPADKEPPAQTDVKPAITPAPQPPSTQLRVPMSWRPEVREKFGALPPEIQTEVVRREREIENGLREAAGARRFTEEFHRAVQPFEAMIRSENSTPLQAVNNLLNTAYQLRTAPPAQKAQLVASMISHFGVDINLLDQALVGGAQGGQGQPSPNDPTMQYVQQQLAPVQQLLQEFQTAKQTAQQRVQQQAVESLEEFRKDPLVAEFLPDVQMDVADIMELAARRGQQMSLRDAFDRATMAHPTISKIIADRKVAQSAQQRSSAAQRARNASASLPSGSAPEQGGRKPAKRGDISSDIASAWDAVESRMQ